MYDGYGYTTTTPTPSGLESWMGGLTAGLIILLVFIALIGIAIAVVMIIAECKVFKKAGEDWWKALIPVYNSWIQTKISGLAWWWFVIVIAIAAALQEFDENAVLYFALALITFNYNYNIAKKFNKSNGFAFLCTILPVIGYPILAFGSAKYEKDTKVDKNGIFKV